jgi:6-phosphogluconolactonase/glucosamine-6-phosphate isomerase/deaminase
METALVKEIYLDINPFCSVLCLLLDEYCVKPSNEATVQSVLNNNPTSHLPENIKTSRILHDPESFQNRALFFSTQST